jgi:septum formation protein
MRLLVASKSSARRAMLEAAGVPFESIDTAADEEAVKAQLRSQGAGGAQLALALAEAKAKGVDPQPGTLILGSDQTLETEEGAVLDKPRSRDEAAKQLCLLGGRTHRLHSTAAIVEEGLKVWEATETVTLAMRTPSASFLRSYLDREYEAIRQGVGGYRIEGLGVQLFDRIEGSHFAILGLPLLPLLDYLREREVIEA